MRRTTSSRWLSSERVGHALRALAVSAMLTTGTLAAASAVFHDPVVQGDNAKLTLNARVTLDATHVGQDVRVFVWAWVPSELTAQGATGRWYAWTAQQWQLVHMGHVWPEAVALPSRTIDHHLTVLNADDIRSVMGASIYIGYGVSSGDTASAQSEMLAQGRYRLIYTINQSPSDTGRSGDELALQATTTSQLQALFAQVQQQRIADEKLWGGISYPAVGTAVSPPPSAPAPAPTSDRGAGVLVSGTTLQEAGVDEDDWVKSDGVFVYSLDGTVATAYGNVRDLLQRRRFNPQEAKLGPPERVGLPWSKGVVGTGLFLDTERQQAIAVAQNTADSPYDAWFPTNRWQYVHWESGVTELAMVDVATNLQLKRHLTLSGVLIGSRRIGSTLYLLLRQHPQWPSDNDPGLVPQGSTPPPMPLESSLPTLRIDQGASQPLVNPADCLVSKRSITGPASADLITLVAIDLAASGHRHSARCFVGATEAFYMSERHVYLATTQQSYAYAGGFPVYPEDFHTDIHQFALNKLDMNYQGSGRVVGHLGFDQHRKSFRMGEHQGVLRVFTQTSPRFGGWIGVPRPMPVVDTAVPINTPTAVTAASTPSTDTTSPGKLTLLQVRNGALATIGELPNAQRPAPLGKPGEQLYASRFLGNRGYLVTYRLIDPLYVVDLSNPTDPYILGELEVSGYSDYLFPLSDNLLLGVGKEAIADGGVGDGRAAWYQGVKLSLIDISNPSAPVEADRRIIGKRGTDATVLHNHHGIALQTRSDGTRVALPVALHDTPSRYHSGQPSDYYEWTSNELQTFDIDWSQKTIRSRSPLVAPKPQRDIQDHRSVLWHEQIHYYTGNEWLSAPW